MASTLDPDVLRSEVEAARGHSQHGQPVLARQRYRALRRRIERAEDGRAEVGAQHVRVMLGLAAAEFEVSGRLGPALALLADAERVAVAAAADGLLASVRGQRGLLLLRSGRRREALRAFDAAAEVRRAADRYDVTSILLNRGVLHLDIGSVDQAARDFEECVEVAGASGDHLLLWKARHNLAYVDFLAGRLPRALAAMETAERALATDLHPIGRLDRARVLREAGLVREADLLLTRVAEELAAAGLEQDLGETLLLRAECALVEGEEELSRVLARRAERLFARRENQQWQRRAQLLLLRGERLGVLGQPARTRAAALRRLAARAGRLAADCRAERRLDLARPAELLALACALRAGDLPAGAAAPRLRGTDPLPLRLLTREVRALVSLHRSDPVRAGAEVRRGLVELGSYQSGFGSLDLRTASAVHGQALARLGLEVALRHDSPAELFAALERGRAVSARLARVGPPTDERTAALLTELRRREQEARDQQGAPGGGEAQAQLRARIVQMQREVRERAWALEGGRHDSDPGGARVGEVRRRARGCGCAFVSFGAHEGRWLAVVVARAAPARRVDLAAAADVEELAQRVRADLDALAMPLLPAALAAAVRRSLTAGLARLDELMVAPLGVPGMPLVVSAGAGLALLPWSLLPSRRALPVVVTPSARTWLRAGPAGPRPSPRVVSVAGPGLHRAEAEARAVRDRWPGARLLTGVTATAARTSEALSGADLVHVAAHGSHQQESPLFSSLRLADGPLYAYELDADERAAPCVVLSACEAGLSTIRPGDEGLGLTSVLLHLGTRSVLAGVARVRDDAAARVMERVHRSMAGGTDSAAALAGALAEEEQPTPFVSYGASW